MGKFAMGLDNGGTTIKAALFDLAGREIAVASRQTRVIMPRPGYTERDMEDLWRGNCDCVREVLEISGVPRDEIIGVAVCGHGKGLYAWGKNGKPARNGIVSTDNRAWRYPEKWRTDGSFEALYPRLCQQLLACQQVSLLAWLKDNERGGLRRHPVGVFGQGLHQVPPDGRSLQRGHRHLRLGTHGCQERPIRRVDAGTAGDRRGL